MHGSIAVIKPPKIFGDTEALTGALFRPNDSWETERTLPQSLPFFSRATKTDLLPPPFNPPPYRSVLSFDPLARLRFFSDKHKQDGNNTVFSSAPPPLSPPPLEPLQPRIPKNSRKLPLRRELSASIHVAENNDPDVLTFSRYLPCARRIAQRAETGGSRGDQLYASLDCFVPFERTPAADSCFGSTMGVVSSENVSLPARLDALLPLPAAVWGCLKSVRPKSGNRAAFESTILIKSL